MALVRADRTTVIPAGSKAFRAALLALGVWMLLTVGWTCSYRFLNPPVTFLMAQDIIEGHPVNRVWVRLESMPPSIRRAVVAAEDSNFCSHSGFDLAAIRSALERNSRSDRLRGGSTISQQTAKNVFLCPGRNWFRKGLEAYFTVLIEAIWGKARIAEVYLNVAEFGEGIFGVQAASTHYFDLPVARLNTTQAARLAAILPQPINRSASSPGPYTRRYANRIERRMTVVTRERLASCIGA